MTLTRRHLFGLTAAAALATPLRAGAADRAGTVREGNVLASKLLGHPVDYALYLPPGYEADSRRYPVIYLLHGAGDGQPADWFRMAGIEVVLDRLILAGEMPPVIAVAPDGRRASGDPRATYFLDDADGGYRWAGMFLEEFIPQVESRYRSTGDPRMRGLMGISMGGFAAVLHQLRHPGLFGGVSALSAAFRTPEQFAAMKQEDYDLRFGGAFGSGLAGQARLNEAWARADVLSLLGQVEAGPFARWPRLYLTLAADDPFFAGNAAVHLALGEAGIRHRFTVTEGRHDWIFWRQALPEALRHLGAVLMRQYGE